MDKDDAFLKELQVNDKVKVTVNFFGQEMPFEGTCTGITDDKLSILTNAKPEPVELPLSAIIEGTITSENKINIEESANDNTYENIEIKHPEVVYGYYIIDLKNENKSHILSNTPQTVDKTDIATASTLLLKEFSKNSIIEDYYNNNVHDLNSISTFSTFYKTNKDRNKNTHKLFHEYIDSYDIYIKTKEFSRHNPIGPHTLKDYLFNLVSLNESLHYLPFYDEKDLSVFMEEYLDSVDGQHLITVSRIFNKELPEENHTHNIKLYTDFLFKYLISLKFIFKINIFQAINCDQDKPNEDSFIKYMTTLLPLFATLDYKEYNDLTKSVDNWLKEQIKKHDLFSPGISQDKTNLIIHFDKPVLVPLISINNSLCQSAKHTLINLMYYLYLSKGRLLYIKVSNNELRKNLTEYIKIKYNLDNDFNLSIKTIFNEFTKTINSFFANLIIICKSFVNIKLSDKDSKESYSIINQNTISIIKSLENEADKYITVTTKFNNGLKLF
ncbi:hypothetical protein, partial [Succinimonas sp.]|uniref:hypothetical protein n=1 Tax=Succinimonas sp. TaxID=1936151 RepID=UPI00386C97F4